MKRSVTVDKPAVYERLQQWPLIRSLLEIVEERIVDAIGRNTNGISRFGKSA